MGEVKLLEWTSNNLGDVHSMYFDEDTYTILYCQPKGDIMIPINFFIGYDGGCGWTHLPANLTVEEAQKRVLEIIPDWIDNRVSVLNMIKNKIIEVKQSGI